MRTRIAWLAVWALAVSASAQQAPAGSPQSVLDRAVAEFERGHIAQSVAGFDELIRLVPTYGPQLWQRGIALYYAGRFDDCRAQFELHRTVNPDDVENAAWHFLCVARGQSAGRARAALLPVGSDPRPPMRQIYEMFRDRATPDEVISAAGGDPSAQFYAELYVGLYLEALGRKEIALAHIRNAAADRFATVGGYMHTVARVHLMTLQR
jgi:lipoprotein NlpI